MTLFKQRVTLDQFKAFIQRSENADRDFEYIAGEICEVVANSYASQTASIVSFHIRLHLQKTGKKGWVTGANGGHIIGAERYVPDVAYTRIER